jgi:hypothetical protein
MRRGTILSYNYFLSFHLPYKALKLNNMFVRHEACLRLDGEHLQHVTRDINFNT